MGQLVLTLGWTSQSPGGGFTQVWGGAWASVFSLNFSGDSKIAAKAENHGISSSVVLGAVFAPLSKYLRDRIYLSTVVPYSRYNFQ